MKILLLDEGLPLTLHTAIGLKDAGWSVSILTTQPGDARFIRRYAKLIEGPCITSSEYLEVIERLVSAEGFTCVLPSTNGTLYRLWDSDARWQTLIYPRTEKWQRALLPNKRKLSEFVAGCGVPVPRFRRIESLEEVPAAVKDLGLPLVVKGVSGAGGGSRIRLARTQEEVADFLRDLYVKGEEWPTLQQFIHGPAFNVYGLFHEGKALRIYAAEQLELSSHVTGAALSFRSCGDPGLIKQGLTVFQSLQWNGLACADFVRNEHGQFLYLDFDAAGMFVPDKTAGVEIIRPLEKLLRGEVPAAELGFRQGVRSVFFPQHLLASLKEGGGRGLASLAMNLRGWQSLPWRTPGLAIHMIRQIYRQWLYLSSEGRKLS